MNTKDIIDLTIEEFSIRGVAVNRQVVTDVVRVVFGVIQRETAHGVPVSIRGFGEFIPRLDTRWAYWNVRLRMDKDWKWRCRIRNRQRKEEPMEKYGYEKKEDGGVKTAAERGKCPICGRETVGEPPVCPMHGSRPFEESEGHDGKKES